MTQTPQPPLQVLQVKHAERTAVKSKVFNDYQQHGLPDGELAMDYNFWVIRSDNTVILVDTGYDVAEAEWLGEVSVTPVPDALSALGIDAATVSMVILSHYHFDHIGYLHLFRNASVVAGQAEDDYWMGLHHGRGLEGEFVNPDHLVAIEQARADGRLCLIDAPTEVHPGVTVHPIAGHCPGQLLVLVQSASGPRIVASDVAHFYEQIEHGWIFFVFSDIDDMHKSFRTLRDLALEHGAEVIPGHDARVRERYPALDGPASSFTNVLG